ncbi:hypothetical protein niasHT_036023 [Heterodera trifolii]|uniref:N-acetylgalactosaminide beta-1,3-galactosyltransferase n=1 Tax=Heterodera trifolii TaxID=157864 RepID=A0ABD2I9Q0_9BILA
MNEFDWVLRADDDAYVILENLRFMLLPYSPDEPIYFGHILRIPYALNSTFPQGGAGYVISRSAFKLIVEQGFTDKTKCKIEDDKNDDQILGICMGNLGVKVGDSRDSQGRHRFFGGQILQLLWPVATHDYVNQLIRNLSFYPISQGLECCSDYPISLHYTDAHRLYLLEYLLYHAVPYGARELISGPESADYYEAAKSLAVENTGPDDTLAK